MSITMEVAMSTKRILIIDDEIHIREVVQTCLETLAGWDVGSVSSSQEGLDWVELGQPDAIILDVMMPEMDGFAFLRQLRSNPTTQSIPVVLLTAMAYKLDQKQFPALGVKTAIAKPFNPLLLLEEIAAALDWSLTE